MEQVMVPPTAPAAPIPPPVSSGTPLPSLGKLFADSFELMKDRALVIFLSGLTIIASLAGFGVIGVVLWGIIRAFNSTAATIVAVILGLLFICAYFYVVVWAAAIPLVALRDAAEKTGVKETIRRSRQVMWSFFLVTLLVGLCVSGGMVLLVIPGIILSVFYMFAPAIMVVEDKKGRAALAQSRAYVFGRGWKIFGRILLAQLIYLAVYLLLLLANWLGKNNLVAIVVFILTIIWQIFYYFYAFAFQFTLYRQVKETAPALDPQKFQGAVTGWAIWGGVGAVLLVVLGMLFSVALLSLSSARSASRDAERFADIRQLSAVLAMYKNEQGSYPTSLNDLSPTYIPSLPVAPTPADGSCTDEQNTYTYSPDYSGKTYSLEFCLGSNIAGFSSGTHVSTPAGVN